jgi:hypothetical protein
LLASLLPGDAWSAAVLAVPPPVPDQARVAAAPRSMPLMFIENVGQLDERARFQMRTGQTALYLADDALWFTIYEQGSEGVEDPRQEYLPLLDPAAPQPRRGANVRLSFVDANPHPRLEPFNRLGTTVSYFIGDDPAKWHADVPVWGGVRYVDLYPGLDLEITSEKGWLLPRLVVRDEAAGLASLQDVRLRLDGADTLVLADAGHLRLTIATGEFTLPLLQTVAADDTPLDHPIGQPEVNGSEIKSPFSLSPAPLLSSSPSLPASLSSQDTSNWLYSTFLGGSGIDQGRSIAVDGAGNAYVTGQTTSPDFPSTPGAFDRHNGDTDAFVVKLNPAGNGQSDLRYATFLGGNDVDWGYGIAVDEAGYAYVAGFTYGADFPTTAGAYYNPDYAGGFLVKLDAGGTDLRYATFLGNGLIVAVDKEGNAYTTGTRTSGTTCEQFVVKLKPDGSGLANAATFFDGDEPCIGSWGIAVDETGNAYVVNVSLVVKVKPGDTEPLYTISLKQTGIRQGWGIAVDGAGNAYVAGDNGHVYKVTDDGTVIDYSTPDYSYLYRAITVDKADNVYVLGGGVFKVTDDRMEQVPGSPGGHGIAVDRRGDVYVTGWRTSSAFPTTEGAYDTSYNGGDNDAFVVKLATGGEGPPPMITGIVLLQGRTAHAGTSIFLSQEPCPGPLSGSPAAVTNDAGHFGIVAPPGQTYQCLQAFQPGYLLGQRVSPQGDLGAITLPAGDVIQDNVIDIFDLTFIADHYHSPDPIADLDADGWVDVYDLAIAGGNYNTNGPVTNWQ